MPSWKDRATTTTTATTEARAIQAETFADLFMGALGLFSTAYEVAVSSERMGDIEAAAAALDELDRVLRSAPVWLSRYEDAAMKTAVLHNRGRVIAGFRRNLAALGKRARGREAALQAMAGQEQATQAGQERATQMVEFGRRKILLDGCGDRRGHDPSRRTAIPPSATRVSRDI